MSHFGEYKPKDLLISQRERTITLLLVFESHELGEEFIEFVRSTKHLIHIRFGDGKYIFEIEFPSLSDRMTILSQVPVGAYDFKKWSQSGCFFELRTGIYGQGGIEVDKNITPLPLVDFYFL